MKITIDEDASCTEEEIIIRCPAVNPEVFSLMKKLQNASASALIRK